jgi:hypothetical protein
MWKKKVEKGKKMNKINCSNNSTERVKYSKNVEKCKK